MILTLHKCHFWPLAHAMYISGPPLGRNMPPIKGRLTDNDGGTYGYGASGPGEPEDSAFASNIKDFIEFHRYIADGENPEARAAQVFFRRLLTCRNLFFNLLLNTALMVYVHFIYMCSFNLAFSSTLAMR